MLELVERQRAPVSTPSNRAQAFDLDGLLSESPEVREVGTRSTPQGATPFTGLNANFLQVPPETLL
jgi:hypothetical protein